MPGRFEKSCEYCGAAYEINEYYSSSREKNKINCEVCGNKLIGWSGGVMYEAYLISRPKKEETRVFNVRETVYK